MSEILAQVVLEVEEKDFRDCGIGTQFYVIKNEIKLMYEDYLGVLELTE